MNIHVQVIHIHIYVINIHYSLNINEQIMNIYEHHDI